MTAPADFEFLRRLRRYLWAILTIPCALASTSGLLTAQINTAQRVSNCKVSQLSATEDRKESDGIDGGTGNHAMTVAVQNRSSLPCVLHGVPSLSVLDAANHTFSVSVCANCDDYLFRSQPVGRIVLEPNKSAYVVLGYNINDGENGEIPCRYAVALSLYLPNESKPLELDVRQGRDKMRSCGPIVVTPFLEKPPVNGFLPEPAKSQK